MTATLPVERTTRSPFRSSVRLRKLAGQGARFAAVGGAATLIQLALYAFVGDCVGAQVANVLSWSVATVIAGVAHHRFTFRLEHSGSERDHLVNLASSLAALLLSSAVLAAAGNPSGLLGTALLLAVNGAVGTGRFVLLRWWLTGRRAVAVVDDTPSIGVVSAPSTALAGP